MIKYRKRNFIHVIKHQEVRSHPPSCLQITVGTRLLWISWNSFYATM